MNFTFNLRAASDGRFGGKKKDGSWNGMIGEVNRGESDMGNHNLSHFCVLKILMTYMASNHFLAIAAFLVTLDRSEAISFTQPVGNVHNKLFIKTPGDSFNTGAYTKTLKGMVWIGIGIFCVVCPPIIFSTTK